MNSVMSKVGVFFCLYKLSQSWLCLFDQHSVINVYLTQKIVYLKELKLLRKAIEVSKKIDQIFLYHKRVH